MKKISVQHIGHEHSDWLRSLDFYKEEIGILKNRLTEIGGKNTSREVALKLEQFENQFSIQRDNIDRLKHDINANVSAISEEARQNGAMYIDSGLRDQHEELAIAVTAEESAINNMRREFNRFSAEWM